MFGRLSSSDFAKVLFIDEKSRGSIYDIISEMERMGIPAINIGNFIRVYRDTNKGYINYRELFDDMKSSGDVNGLDELKIMLVMYSLWWCDGEIDYIDMLRVIEGMGRYLEYSKGFELDFSKYESLIRDMM